MGWLDVGFHEVRCLPMEAAVCWDDFEGTFDLEVGCISLCLCFNSSFFDADVFFFANKVYTSDQLSFTIIPQENI